VIFATAVVARLLRSARSKSARSRRSASPIGVSPSCSIRMYPVGLESTGGQGPSHLVT
jgi:hypothetical protein